MKKIMFNDKYGLTDAVLEGRKTQTRRVINLTDTDKEYLDTAFDWDLRESVIIDRYAKYKVGEVVAVAQSYETIISNMDSIKDIELLQKQLPCTAEESWHNKMFVKADLMPHHIRITNIRIEQLQDISNADCLAEGIFKCILDNENGIGIPAFSFDYEAYYFDPRSAYAALIDKVSGKGTWESNPYVFVYDFVKVD